MMGVSGDHSTLYCCVQNYAPEIEKRLRWQWRQPKSTSWRVDETYIKVRGTCAYLYRAVDKFGDTIDFYLSPTRNTAAASAIIQPPPPPKKKLGPPPPGAALSFCKTW